jgi:phenylalanyl-tRNA synthetase alpha chain
MLLPMGFPTNVRIIAWGLSLERPAMIHFGYDNIRKLFGHEVRVSDNRDARVYTLLNS